MSIYVFDVLHNDGQISGDIDRKCGLAIAARGKGANARRLTCVDRSGNVVT